MNAQPPRRHAAAIAYDETDARRRGAPRVVAKGHGLVADEIIERARAAGVPIHASRELAALLTQVDLDQQIPPALYVAVAEVLVWVYRLEGRAAPAAERN
jgi:flagellar biosynthesis protein